VSIRSYPPGGGDDGSCVVVVLVVPVLDPLVPVPLLGLPEDGSPAVGAGVGAGSVPAGSPAGADGGSLYCCSGAVWPPEV
jgi:hypothetical protein